MNARLIWAPIDRWPREQTKRRESSAFKRSKGDWQEGTYRREEIPWTQTQTELVRELNLVGIREAVVQLALRDRDIRNDGQVRADARPSHPGVIVSFVHPKQGPLTFACDKWTTWQANIRGITKGLEALRLLDRYGITTSGEQYKGWKELGSGTPMGEHVDDTPMSRMEAARVIAGAVSNAHNLELHTREVHDDADFARWAYKHAVKLAHPDTGGSHEGFLRVHQAMKVLSEVES